MSSIAGSGQTTISNTNNDGWLLSQNAYAIVSSIVEVILSAGLGGIVWIICKRYKTVMLYTIYQVDMNTVLKCFLKAPFLRRSGKKSSLTHWIIFLMFIVCIVASQLSTILNFIVKSYTVLGNPSVISSTYVDRLGPVSYMSRVKLADVANVTNSVTYGLLASLFASSSFLAMADNSRGDGCSTGKVCERPLVDSSCSPLSNVLLNAPGTIANATGVPVYNTSFPDPFWEIYSSMNSAQSYVGSISVEALLNSSPDNVASFLFQRISSGSKSVFYYQPLIGSASMGSSYLYMWGAKGNPEYIPTAGGNNTLRTTLIDVVNIAFGSAVNGYDNLKSFNNYGMCYEANTPYGQSYFCIPINTYKRQIDNGTESYDVVVFSPTPWEKSTTTVMLPFTNARYVETSLFKKLILNPNGQVTQQSFEISPNATSYFWTNYQVTMKTKTAVTYNVFATDNKPPTAVLSRLPPFASSCQAANSNGLFNSPSDNSPTDNFNPGDSCVLMNTWFVYFWAAVMAVCFVCWWFNDFSNILVEHIKYACHNDDIDSFEGILKESFCGAAYGQSGDHKIGIMTKTDESRFGKDCVVVIKQIKHGENLIGQVSPATTPSTDGKTNEKAPGTTTDLQSVRVEMKQ